jgi:uncharacterized surface protein with fasciclin (FAS1) repeats
MSNIVEVVTGDKNLTALGKGIKVAGLEEVLSKEGPFTIFAPTDLAFGKLATGKWLEMLQPHNKIILAGMVNNYVVEGRTNFKDLTDGQKLTTLGGKELAVKVDNGKVDIDGARILGRDMEASNGVVHSVDRVASFK